MCWFFCCGLLAKWLTIRVMIGVLGLELGLGSGNAMHFLSSGLISVENTFIFSGSVGMRWITYEYSICIATECQVRFSIHKTTVVQPQ